jgi:hypothetical protein
MITRSNNQTSGLEYTWSVWLYFTDLPQTGYDHIFNKGNNEYAGNGTATVNNCPGLYLGSDNQSALLHLMIDTTNNDTPSVIDISNIPLNKWVHVAIRVKNTIVDVYVNGIIDSRILLPNVPKQNYDNVFICQNGGFNGNLSALRYYNSALNIFDINSIVSYGPDMNLVTRAGSGMKFGSNYLSRQWYSY